MFPREWPHLNPRTRTPPPPLYARGVVMPPQGTHTLQLHVVLDTHPHWRARTQTPYYAAKKNSPLTPVPCACVSDHAPPAYVEKALFEGAMLTTLGATVAVAAVPDTGMPLAPSLMCVFCCDVQRGSTVCVFPHTPTCVKGRKHTLQFVCCSTFFLLLLLLLLRPHRLFLAQ